MFSTVVPLFWFLIPLVNGHHWYSYYELERVKLTGTGQVQVSSLLSDPGKCGTRALTLRHRVFSFDTNTQTCHTFPPTQTDMGSYENQTNTNTSFWALKGGRE